jgi:hypothetical protein
MDNKRHATIDGPYRYLHENASKMSRQKNDREGRKHMKQIEIPPCPEKQ